MPPQKNKQYSVIFLRFKSDTHHVNIFNSIDQTALKELLAPLGIPTDKYWVLPPLPFPENGHSEIVKDAILKMDGEPFEMKNRRALISKLFLEALKGECTNLSSPVILETSHRTAKEFMLKINNANLKRFISNEKMHEISDALEIVNLTDFALEEEYVSI